MPELQEITFSFHVPSNAFPKHVSSPIAPKSRGFISLHLPLALVPSHWSIEILPDRLRSVTELRSEDIAVALLPTKKKTKKNAVISA